MILFPRGIPAGFARLYHFEVIDESAIRQRFEALAPVLDERGRRRFAAAEARSAGRGGIIAVMRATGIARSTIGRGLSELRAGEPPEAERVRRPGGGRKPLSETDASLLDDFLYVVVGLLWRAVLQIQKGLDSVSNIFVIFRLF